VRVHFDPSSDYARANADCRRHHVEVVGGRPVVFSANVPAPHFDGRIRDQIDRPVASG
jgi:hypothetical protein